MNSNNVAAIMSTQLEQKILVSNADNVEDLQVRLASAPLAAGKSDHGMTYTTASAVSSQPSVMYSYGGYEVSEYKSMYEVGAGGGYQGQEYKSIYDK
jgi:hypothetical protein